MRSVPDRIRKLVWCPILEMSKPSIGARKIAITYGVLIIHPVIVTSNKNHFQNSLDVLELNGDVAIY